MTRPDTLTASPLIVLYIVLPLTVGLLHFAPKHTGLFINWKQWKRCIFDVPQYFNHRQKHILSLKGPYFPVLLTRVRCVPSFGHLSYALLEPGPLSHDMVWPPNRYKEDIQSQDGMRGRARHDKSWYQLKDGLQVWAA